MTDIEMTRLCAQALVYTIITERQASKELDYDATILVKQILEPYCPLTNKAQAFDLIEKFHIVIIPGLRTPKGRAPWHAEIKSPDWEAYDDDLKRAVVLSVAKMQKDK